MKIFKNSQSLFLKNLKYINDTKFIFYSHLGLGDQIILSGAVNFLSKKYNKIYVVSFNKFQNSMDLLYSNNDSIKTSDAAHLMLFNAMGRANSILYLLWDKHYENWYNDRLKILGKLTPKK